MTGNNIYIERLNEGSTIDCKAEIDDIVDAIVEEYRSGDVCIGEVLDALTIHGLSIEDTVIVYAKVYEITDGDKVIRVNDEYELDLANELIGGE